MDNKKEIKKVSKYAAKKAALAKQASEVVTETEQSVDTSKANPVFDEEPEGVKPTKAPKPKNKSKYVQKLPEHLQNLVLLLTNNAEIRRYTAIGIINYLTQKGEIKGEKKYVSFLWDKFILKVDGWQRVYHYNEKFFITALVASFSSFAASAQRTINEFVKNEFTDSPIDKEEVEKIQEENTKDL